MTNPVRKGEGKPLRDAMKRLRVTQAELAARTKVADPRGKGVSLGTVVKVTGRGKYSSNQCRPRTARLIAEALGEPVDEHFDMPPSSTATVERSSPDGDTDPR
ncbi:XRE family transcriptional regulator [Streptomyces sp. adm13(2018)]|nr:XRE family transcriptional regulator [Streptomyces sp. adm13(2018)]